MALGFDPTCCPSKVQHLLLLWFQQQQHRQQEAVSLSSVSSSPSSSLSSLLLSSSSPQWLLWTMRDVYGCFLVDYAIQQVVAVAGVTTTTTMTRCCCCCSHQHNHHAHNPHCQNQPKQSADAVHKEEEEAHNCEEMKDCTILALQRLETFLSFVTTTTMPTTRCTTATMATATAAAAAVTGADPDKDRKTNNDDSTQEEQAHVQVQAQPRPLIHLLSLATAPPPSSSSSSPSPQLEQLRPRQEGQEPTWNERGDRGGDDMDHSKPVCSNNDVRNRITKIPSLPCDGGGGASPFSSSSSSSSCSLSSLSSWMNVMQQCIRLLHMYGPPYILYQTAHSTGCNVVHLTLRRLVGVVTQCQCTQHSRKKGEGL